MGTGSCSLDLQAALLSSEATEMGVQPVEQSLLGQPVGAARTHTRLRPGAEQGFPHVISRNGSQAAAGLSVWLVLMSLPSPPAWISCLVQTLGLPPLRPSQTPGNSPGKLSMQEGVCRPGPGCEEPASPSHSALSPPGSDSLLAGSAGPAAFGPTNSSHLERAVAAGGAQSPGAPRGCCIWK